MSVFDDLVGQERVVQTLHRAVAAATEQVVGGVGRGMTHAWLFTGPPGSGRSNAARAFAAALQCDRGGCGECQACRNVLAGSHPDVTLVRTDKLVLGVDEMRQLVRDAALRPGVGRWQVIVIEDADRLHERAADALLKSLEEPASRTVWMLCAPSIEDVKVTIASRSRTVMLRTPPAEAIADMLIRSDARVTEAVAAYAARASQGHVGRARALATDEKTRNRRREILQIPLRLRDVGSCVRAAANVYEAAEEVADEIAAARDAGEVSDLEMIYGIGTRGVKTRGFAGELSSLQKEQKQRHRRSIIDSIDGVLIELLSFYRDALMVALGPDTELINADSSGPVRELSGSSTPEQTLARMETILACREALPANAAPLLALESMMIGLHV